MPYTLTTGESEAMVTTLVISTISYHDFEDVAGPRVSVTWERQDSGGAPMHIGSASLDRAAFKALCDTALSDGDTVSAKLKEHIFSQLLADASINAGTTT